MEQALASLRAQRQQLQNLLDENPSDSIAFTKLCDVNTQIQKLIADKNRATTLKPTLVQKERDFVIERKKRGLGSVVKLGVKYWAIQYIMLYPDVYPEEGMNWDVCLPGDCNTIFRKPLPFMVPKQLAEDLALAFPTYFNLL